MGNNCCLAAKDSGATAPFIPPITTNKPVYQTIIETPNDGSGLDLIYAQQRQELKDLSSRLNIPKLPTAYSKRSSQPSLLRLNNEITHMIHTFEKAHGTIGNELTRSNSISSNCKIKELTNDVGEIGLLKKKRASDAIVIGNEEVSTTQKPNLANALSISLNEGEEIKKITEQSHNDTIQQSYDSSTPHNNDECSDPAEASKNLLDAELVDEDAERYRQELYQKNGVIEGNIVPLWEIFDTQSFSLDLTQLVFEPENAVIFSAMGSIIFYYGMFKITLPAYSRDLDNGVLLVKLWINGTKRCLKVDDISTKHIPTEVFSEAIKKLYGQNPINKSPCQQVYHLSGWCPECLLMEEISNKDNLWDRLAENFLEGNIIISFGRGLKQGQQTYLTLKNVKREEGILEVLSPEGPPLPDMPINLSNIYQVEWSRLSSTVERIYINWNPSIYSYNRKFDSCWTVFPDSGPFQDEQICIANNPQFLIKIPKHDEDFEIRIFIDRHVKQFKQNQHVLLKLFEYDGVKALDPRSSIRNLDSSDRQLLSDVFIFEKSQEVDHFILTVMSGNQEKITEQICFSILFLSFIEIQVTQLPIRQTILTQNLSSDILEENVGMGINSPSFTNNLHYSLQVPPQSDIQILVEGHEQMDFSIILLEDSNRLEDLLKIDFETILNDNIATDIFHGYGFLQKEAKLESYILVIACYGTSQCSSRVKITVNVVSKLHRRNRQVEECYPPIKMNQIFCRPNIIKTFPIKWSKENTGQRKRLKNTTTPIYHPVSTFTEFLKNPCTQIRLPRGRYQFNVVSEDYKKEFLLGNPYEKEQKMLQPPALSMAILRLSDNEKGYKIILDDAFYVPLGYGFWTEQLVLEQGKYTIVCPRINRQIGKGTMKIRQL